jgi:hypothetical protein
VACFGQSGQISLASRLTMALHHSLLHQSPVPKDQEILHNAEDLSQFPIFNAKLACFPFASVSKRRDRQLPFFRCSTVSCAVARGKSCPLSSQLTDAASKVGMLFMDFEIPWRIHVQGDAKISKDPEFMAHFCQLARRSTQTCERQRQLPGHDCRAKRDHTQVASPAPRILPSVRQDQFRPAPLR